MPMLVASGSADRLRDIIWMVHSLDTLTLAGQRYTIGKIVELLEEEIADRRRADRDAAPVSAVLDALKREAKRLLPDVSSFSRQAETLIGVVEAAS